MLCYDNILGDMSCMSSSETDFSGAAHSLHTVRVLSRPLKARHVQLCVGNLQTCLECKQLRVELRPYAHSYPHLPAFHAC
jgi:hypothetical protein